MATNKKEEKQPVTVNQPQQEAPKKIYRSRTDRMLGGVCGGFAEYFNIDATLMRVLWVLAGFLNGLGVLAYIISWIVVPENPNPSEESAKETSEPKNTGLIWGTVLIVIGLFFLFQQLDLFDHYPFQWYWPHRWFTVFQFDILWPLIIILIGVIYLVSVLKKEKQPEKLESKETSGGEKMEKKLTRSVKDKMIGGVCGGIANYFNIDASIIRIAWALLTLAGGLFIGVVTYIVMLIIIPEESIAEATTPAPKAASSKSKK